MEIRQMQTFKAVIEAGSFIKAAEQLQYAQSSITAHIQGIEEELGVQLFNRAGKKLILTEAGKELYSYVIELLNIYEKMFGIGLEGDNLRGNIRIGASETLTIYRLGPVLQEFRTKYPDVYISLINDNCAKMREKLYSGEIDFALILEPEVKDDNLTFMKFNEEEVVFIASSNSDIEELDNDLKNNIFDDTIIFTEHGCALRNSFQAYLRNKNMVVKNKIQLSNIEAIKQCVASGLGVSFLPYVSVEALIKQEKIKKINEKEKIYFLSQLAYLKSKKLNLAEKKFIEVLTKYL